MCAVSIFLLTAITEWRMIFLTTNLMTNLKRSNMNNRIPEDHWLLMRPIAHRGLHNNEYPENSLAAFWNAVKNDRPIELDVHITPGNENFRIDWCLNGAEFDVTVKSEFGADYELKRKYSYSF